MFGTDKEDHAQVLAFCTDTEVRAIKASIELWRRDTPAL